MLFVCMARKWWLYITLVISAEKFQPKPRTSVASCVSINHACFIFAKMMEG